MVAGIELFSISATLSDSVFVGLSGSLTALPIFQLRFQLVFHDLSRSFPGGLVN